MKYFNQVEEQHLHKVYSSPKILLFNHYQLKQGFIHSDANQYSKHSFDEHYLYLTFYSYNLNSKKLFTLTNQLMQIFIH